MTPFDPTYSTPLSCSFRPAGSSAGAGGIRPPSYQVIRTGGRSPRAGNSYVMIEAIGNVSKLGFMSGKTEPSSVQRASTDVGVPSPSAQTGWSMMWQPMSPNAPVPKSRQPRQLWGAYAG